MKPLYTRLQEARRELGTPWEVLERDYLLSWILAGIERVDSLNGTLIFKGGTALKKCYFGAYRFSEDLDFSTLGAAPADDSMEAAMRKTCQAATELLDEYAPVEIGCERHTERDPHPEGQEAFTIRARFPWHRQLHTRVKVEITRDEPILKPPPTRRVLHEYGEPLEASVRTYALAEIAAEKLRAILQHMEELHVRGWSRSRARDYYDLWRIMGAYGEPLDLSDFVPFLREKCSVRNVSFDGPEDFFQEPMLSHIKRTWNQWLGQLVPELPSFETVIEELRPRIGDLIPQTN